MSKNRRLIPSHLALQEAKEALRKYGEVKTSQTMHSFDTQTIHRQAPDMLDSKVPISGRGCRLRR
jgi:hypothetical protein